MATYQHAELQSDRLAAHHRSRQREDRLDWLENHSPYVSHPPDIATSHGSALRTALWMVLSLEAAGSIAAAAMLR